MSTQAEFKPSVKSAPSVYDRAVIKIGKLVNCKLKSVNDLVKLERKGVPVAVIDVLVKQGFSDKDLHWVINPRTLRHRKESSKMLSPAETGRWVRAAKIQQLAFEVFQDKEKALCWLHKKRKAFEGLAAIEMIHTEMGAQIIEETLLQLDAGFVA